jgi:hypothetical protein
MSDEIGENGTYHSHVFVICESEVSFSIIKSILPYSHIEICKGTSKQARAYVFKTGLKWTNTAKADTRVDGTQVEFGTMLDEELSDRLDDIYWLVKQGYKAEDILSGNILISPDVENSTDEGIPHRELINIFVEGTSYANVLKYIANKYGRENVFNVTKSINMFYGYKGEDVIVFNNAIQTRMLSHIEHYMDVKYDKEFIQQHKMIPAYTKLFILSEASLFQAYIDECKRLNPRKPSALFNKIQDIVKFDNGTHEQFSVSDYVKLHS